jgi:voltage-gated potassium channel
MPDRDIDQHLERIEWGRQQDNGEILLSPAWEVFVLGVSMLSVFNMAFLWWLPNPDLDMVIIIMDSILTIVFLLDLLRRLAVAQDRRAYVVRGYGWVDILAVFPPLRIFRLLRIIRVARVMARFGGPVHAFKAFFSNKAEGGLLSVLLVAIMVMEFGALAVLAVERGAAGSTIDSAQDAIWYLIVTMSTVGYGDTYPVTDLGRLIGSLIIVVGVGVFGTLTGFLANAFVAPSETVGSVLTSRSDAASDGTDARGGELEERASPEQGDAGAGHRT